MLARAESPEIILGQQIVTRSSAIGNSRLDNFQLAMAREGAGAIRDRSRASLGAIFPNGVLHVLCACMRVPMNKVQKAALQLESDSMGQVATRERERER